MSSNVPPDGEPEILDSSGGQQAGAPRRGGSRRTALIAGGIVGAVALVGGAAWAATWYFSSGPDAAEVLPATTIGYAQINLDPSGDQKIEALRTFNKFPGFKDELDLDATDDIRKHLFEEIQNDGTCPDLDYAKDIEPWLGDRMAFAAVDAGEDDPSPVFVVQVSDGGEAEDGLDKLLSCGSAASSDESGSSGYVVDGEWAVLAETQDLGEQVVESAEEGTLADDEDYRHWTDEAGDDGIMTLYAAPEAGNELATLMQDRTGMASLASGGDLAGAAGTVGMESTESAVSDDTVDQLEDFKGAAIKVRFSDGSIEAQFAAEVGQTDLAEAFAGDSGAEVVSTLPDDTALALGGSFEEGWFTALLEWAAEAAGDGASAEERIAEIEDESGLELPEDAETLTGEAFAIAVSSDIDIEELVNNDDASNLGVGVKVQGDPAAVEEVLDKIRPQTEDETLLQSQASGDYVSFGPDPDWLDELSEDGDLGGFDTYRDVVPESDRASSVFYLNVDAGDDWLVRALEDADTPADVVENVEPFSAFGVSSWFDGNTVHGLVKLTTD